MIELKYNETSQLQVRLAILESQLKVANNKIKYLEKIKKEEVNKAYIKIQKKIHPDISPETSRLSSIVNEAKEIVLKDIN